MLLEILGCHGGSVPKRRLPSFLINGTVLLEAGSVTAALPLGTQAGIEHVLLTHAHLDHTVGLAFLVDNIQSAQTATGRNAAVTAAAVGTVVDDLRTYCFNNCGSTRCVSASPSSSGP
jgi:glyoxylase-like metal-dependent hydrolase (beta-lactamase superfamily II)